MLRLIYEIEVSGGIEETKFQVVDKLYSFKSGLLDLSDLSFSLRVNSLSGIENSIKKIEVLSSFRGIIYTLKETENGESCFKYKIFHDKKNPFYKILQTYIPEKGFSIITPDRYIDVDLDKIIQQGILYKDHKYYDYIKLENGVCVLNIPCKNRTLFYYPNSHVKRINEEILIQKGTSLVEIVDVIINNKRYLYNILSHKKIEISKDSFTDGIVLSELKQNCLDISLILF